MSFDLEKTRKAPIVVSEAKPTPEDLLQARADIQSHPEIRELFLKNLSPDALIDRLATALHKLWSNGDPSEAAQFLVDEYAQLGATGMHLVSTETGRVLHILGEEDIYQPAPVPREGGGMATPLQRIRPDLEAALISWHHDAARETQALAFLAAQGHQTTLLREEGDPRLLVATRAGRKHIVTSLGQIPPQTLLESIGGTAGTFLRHFEFGEPPEGHDLFAISGKALSQTQMYVQDAKTLNLHHNRAGTMQGVLTQGWVRQIAYTLSKKLPGVPQRLDITSEKLPSNFWVAPPDMVRPFRKLSPMVQVLPVEGVTPITLEGSVGYLKVPPEFLAQSREIFDRWEAGASLEFQMWVDLSRIHTYQIEGVDVTSLVL